MKVPGVLCGDLGIVTFFISVCCAFACRFENASFLVHIMKKAALGFELFSIKFCSVGSRKESMFFVGKRSL